MKCIWFTIKLIYKFIFNQFVFNSISIFILIVYNINIISLPLNFWVKSDSIVSDSFNNIRN